MSFTVEDVKRELDRIDIESIRRRDAFFEQLKNEIVFTPDGAMIIPDINLEGLGLEKVNSKGEEVI